MYTLTRVMSLIAILTNTAGDWPTFLCPTKGLVGTRWYGSPLEEAT
jgi:hypothetical protein